MKVCARCKTEQPHEHFKRDKNRADGHYPYCKACCRAEYLANQAHNQTYAREYYAAHREEGQQAARQYRAENPEKAREIDARFRQSEKRKAWRDANRQSLNERSAAWRKANPEYCLAQTVYWQDRFRETQPEEWLIRQRRYHRAWKNRNREHFRALTRRYSIQWNAEHPEAKLAHKHARRARQHAAVGTFTAMDWRLVKARYAYRCLCCGLSEPEIKLTVDHVIPLAKGGSNGIENIQPLCGPCNSRKHVATTDFRPVRLSP